MLFCFFFFLRAPKGIHNRAHAAESATVIEKNEPRVVMYLPLIGGGNLGHLFPAPKVSKQAQRPPIASAPKPAGLSYPGRQEIISDPSDPTNQIQTLEQPALEKPPILPPPLLLPNIVQIAESQTKPLPELSPAPEKMPEPAKVVEPPPVKPPEPIKPKEPPPVPQPVIKPPKEEKPIEPPPPPPKAKEPPKPKEPPVVKEQPKPPIEPVPAKKVEPPRPEEPPPVPMPVLKPVIPPVAPMVLPVPVEPQAPVEVPKVTPPPPVPPKVEKQPVPDPKPAPEPKPALEPKQSPEPKPAPAPKPAAAPKKEIPKEPERASGEVPKPKPAVPAIEKRKETPAAPADSTAPDRGSDQKDLLALTPMPAPLQKTTVIPQGEARGRFAISPNPNLTVQGTALGSKSDSAKPEPVAANRTEAPPAPGIAREQSMPTVVNIGPVSGSAKSKEAIGNSAAKSQPKSREIQIVGGASVGSSKDGSSDGGVNPGQGTGAGAGSGSGPGKKKPFSGITIVGGAYDPGSAANAAPVVQARRPIQTAYGVTAISTENSGGGLPNMGVFTGEQIYTVYLDMRREESDPAPSWTLEFALLRDSSGSDAASRTVVRNQEGMILPFPIEKPAPSWPNELISKYRGQRVIIYAVINKEGKMDGITVKDSPDVLLNKPLLQVLSQWLFRPAQLQGAPVAVKALFGIPLWMPR
jgi:hypothetical protein